MGTCCNICGSRKGHHAFTRPDGLKVFECSRCGLAYVNPRLTKEEILQGYKNTVADFKSLKNLFYEDRRIGNSRRMLKYISRFKKLPGVRILDIGCGPGFLLYEAKKLGMDVLGLEISKSLASFGRKELNLDIRETILEEANLAQESFDIVICNNLIEHLPDPSKFFPHVTRILTPGGILCISTPNYDGVKEYGNKWPGFYKDFEHIFYFNSSSLTYVLEPVGLKSLRFFYLPQQAGLTGRENVSYEISSLRARVRGILLSIPLLNRQIWKMLSWVRMLANLRLIKTGRAFEMVAIFQKA